MRSTVTLLYLVFLTGVATPSSLSTDDPNSQVKVSTTGYISPIDPKIYDLDSIATIEGHTRNAILEGNRYKLEHQSLTSKIVYNSKISMLGENSEKNLSTVYPQKLVKKSNGVIGFGSNLITTQFYQFDTDNKTII